MSETTTINYSTKCIQILFVIYFVSSLVQAKISYKVFVIERVVPRDVNYLALKYDPAGVSLPDLGTEFWEPLLEFSRKWNMYPRVEIGPGAFKSEVAPRSPDKLAQAFKKLIGLKYKKEASEKQDLNKGKEFF